MHYRTPKHSELLMKIIYLSSVGIPYCGRLWARRHSKYCVQEFFLSHEWLNSKRRCTPRPPATKGSVLSRPLNGGRSSTGTFVATALVCLAFVGSNPCRHNYNSFDHTRWPQQLDWARTLEKTGSLVTTVTTTPFGLRTLSLTTVAPCTAMLLRIANLAGQHFGRHFGRHCALGRWLHCLQLCKCIRVLLLHESCEVPLALVLRAIRSGSKTHLAHNLLGTKPSLCAWKPHDEWACHRLHYHEKAAAA